MKIYHWMDLDKPGPTSSRAIQSLAEFNWSYFGENDHDGYESPEKALESQGRNQTLDPRLGYFGASQNLAAALELYFPDLSEVHAFIRKEGSQHCVKSHAGKNMGCYPSHEGAAKRLRQVEYFKRRHKARMVAFGMAMPGVRMPGGGMPGGGMRRFGMDTKPKIGRGLGGFGRAPGLGPL
jgi:hypothetical protein